jgi:hypothetical protein
VYKCHHPISSAHAFRTYVPCPPPTPLQIPTLHSTALHRALPPQLSKPDIIRERYKLTSGEPTLTSPQSPAPARSRPLQLLSRDEQHGIGFLSNHADFIPLTFDLLHHFAANLDEVGVQKSLFPVHLQYLDHLRPRNTLERQFYRTFIKFNCTSRKVQPAARTWGGAAAFPM